MVTLKAQATWAFCVYNPRMIPERTPLLLERRQQTKSATHKAVDQVRHRLKKHRRKLPHSFMVAQRSMDMPPSMPRLGMTMTSALGGPVGVGGVIRHS